MSNNNTTQRRGRVYPMTIVARAITTGTTSPKAEGATAQPFSRITADVTTGNKTRSTTVMAFGKAHEEISNVIKLNEPLKVRMAYDQAPAQGDNKRGGQALRIVGLPKAAAAPAQKAA